MTGKSPSRRSSVRVEGDIKIPGIGGVKVGPADKVPDQNIGSDLDKVIAALDSSSRAAGWFADQESRPGQWVHFEAPLSYTAISGLVIFLDPGKPTDNYPTGGAVRLVLHGSAVHLTGSTSVTAIPERAIGRSRFYQMMRDLDHYLTVEEAKLSVSTAPAPEDESLPSRLDRVITILDRSLDLEHTAAWMAGYARITAKLTSASGVDLVITTPLYVEYIAEPNHELRSQGY